MSLTHLRLAAASLAVLATTLAAPTALVAMPHPDAQLLQQKLDDAAELAPAPTFVVVNFHRADGQIRDAVTVDLTVGVRYQTHRDFNARGLVTRVATSSYSTTYEYDAYDHVIREASSSGSVITRTFDALGRQITWSSAYPGRALYTSVTTYGVDGREIVETRSDGIVTTRRLDERGNEIYYLYSTPTTPGVPIFRTYILANKLATAKAGEFGPVTRYFYDARDLATHVVHDGQVTSTYAHDEQGRETLFTTGSYNKITTYDDDTRKITTLFSVYDANGTIYRSTDTVQNDELGRQVSRQYVDDESSTITYDLYD